MVRINQRGDVYAIDKKISELKILKENEITGIVQNYRPSHHVTTNNFTSSHSFKRLLFLRLQLGSIQS